MNVHPHGFDWDNANAHKCQKHGVSIQEIEFLFLNDPAVLHDARHSENEIRFVAIGETKNSRYIFVIFTMREKETQTFIRPISARYMHRKEIAHYNRDI